MAIFPHTPSDLSIEWLNDNIARSDSSCEFMSFDIDEGIGALSDIAEVVRVTLEHGSTTCGPSSIVLKFPKLDRLARLPPDIAGPYASEANLYRLLSERSELAVPRLIGAPEGATRGQVIVILEDVSPANSGSQVAGCDIRDAKTILNQIAQIHALFWGRGSLPENPSGKVVAPFVEQIIAKGWDLFIVRYGSELSDTLAAWKWIQSNIESIFEHRRSTPSTLIHGDLHLENVLFTKDAVRPTVLIDWQLSGRGLAAHDVSYFLVGSLTVEDRRQHEEELLRNYYRQLVYEADLDYSFDDFYIDYRAALTRSMFRPLSSIGRATESDYSTELRKLTDAFFERINAAIIDLDPVDAMNARGY